MGNTDLVSVIVNIYNEETYLPQCIESILGQTYKNLEVILVDDGSSDSSPRICEEYAKRDARVKFLCQKNGGLVSARKLGLRAATGEYVAYVDGDDWVEPNLYEDLLSNAVRSGADVVAAGHKEEMDGHVVEILQNAVPVGVYKGKNLTDKIYATMLYSGNFSQFGIFTFVWNKLFRRSVLYPNQMNVDDRIFIGEDAACVYPCLLSSSVVCVTDSAYYHYRQRVNSSVKTLGKSQLELQKLNVLYQYLHGRFQKSEHAALLLPQVDYFLLSLLTVRSNRLPTNAIAQHELYPFNDVNVGDKIVVCGAGTFGQHLYRRLKESKNFQVIGWVDELFVRYQSLGLAVEELSSVHNMAYDRIVIAFIDKTVADRIANQLCELGVPADNIARISHYQGDVPALLQEFGLEIEA